MREKASEALDLEYIRLELHEVWEKASGKFIVVIVPIHLAFTLLTLRCYQSIGKTVIL